MPTVNNNRKNWKELYSGFDTTAVGAGIIDPSIYSDALYAKRKSQTILIGSLTQITYGFWENDAHPLILTLGFEPQYNTIICLNLHYINEKARHQIIQYVIKSNIKRIKKNQPIIIDYNRMKRAIPVTAMIVRRYKVVGVKIIEQFPLTAWGVAIKGNNKWNNHYKAQNINKSDSIMKRFSRSVSNFFQ